MKKRTLKRIVIVVLIVGYIVFALLTGGIFVYNSGKTYLLTSQTTMGKVFPRPFFGEDRKEILIPFIFSYCSFHMLPQIELSWGWSGIGIGKQDDSDNEECIVLKSAVYVQKNGTKHDLLANLKPEERIIKIKGHGLIIPFTIPISEGDTCTLEGTVHFKDGSSSEGSSTYVAKEFDAEFGISLLMYNVPMG